MKLKIKIKHKSKFFMKAMAPVSGAEAVGYIRKPQPQRVLTAPFEKAKTRVLPVP